MANGCVAAIRKGCELYGQVKGTVAEAKKTVADVQKTVNDVKNIASEVDGLRRSLSLVRPKLLNKLHSLLQRRNKNL